jgi:hypothetical protein
MNLDRGKAWWSQSVTTRTLAVSTPPYAAQSEGRAALVDKLAYGA